MDPNTIRAYLIPALAPPKLIDLASTLDSFQAAVGGLLELVTLTEDAAMYMDEEAKFKDRAPNVVASYAVEHYRPGFVKRDVICGDALVVGFDEHGGEIDVPASVVAAIDDATGWRQAL